MSLKVLESRYSVIAIHVALFTYGWTDIVGFAIGQLVKIIVQIGHELQIILGQCLLVAASMMTTL